MQVIFAVLFFSSLTLFAQDRYSEFISACAKIDYQSVAAFFSPNKKMPGVAVFSQPLKKNHRKALVFVSQTALDKNQRGSKILSHMLSNYHEWQEKISDDTRIVFIHQAPLVTTKDTKNNINQKQSLNAQELLKRIICNRCSYFKEVTIVYLCDAIENQKTNAMRYKRMHQSLIGEVDEKRNAHIFESTLFVQELPHIDEVHEIIAEFPNQDLIDDKVLGRLGVKLLLRIDEDSQRRSKSQTQISNNPSPFYILDTLKDYVTNGISALLDS